MIALAEGGKLTISFIYWLLMLLWVIFGIVWYWPRVPTPAPAPRSYAFGHVLIFVLFFILGYAEFGWPIGGR